MPASTLNIGPMRIDPKDPDVVGNLTGSSGVRYEAEDLIRENAAIYAPLTPVLALGRDGARSDTLDLDEVGRVIGGEVEGASVKGSGKTPRIVSYIVRYPSGRSARGVVPYDEKSFPKSVAAYEDKVNTDLEVARASKGAGASERDVGEDPRVAVLQAKLKELEEAAESAADPEPFVGYGDLKIPEIIEKIDAVEDPVEREMLKRSIRAYESEHSPRKGVLEATEPTALAPVPEDPA